MIIGFRLANQNDRLLVVHIFFVLLSCFQFYFLLTPFWSFLLFWLLMTAYIYLNDRVLRLIQIYYPLNYRYFNYGIGSACIGNHFHKNTIRFRKIVCIKIFADVYTEKLFISIFTIVFFNLGKNVSFWEFLLIPSRFLKQFRSIVERLR